MACCGSKRWSLPVRTTQQPLVLKPAASVPAPATKGPQADGVCALLIGDPVLASGANGNILVIELADKWFELFSAARQQGCSERVQDVEVVWNRTTLAAKKVALSNLGARFTLSSLRRVLASLP